MQAIGLILGAIIAIGGWIVSQYQARRAVRRNMRIDYLLDAYRRLERVTNRVMSVDDERDIEAACSDILLLGSPAQVQLVETFAREFANRKVANPGPLLEDLRMSLRRELLLEAVPPVGVWLRIDRGSESEPARPQSLSAAKAQLRSADAPSE
jgi:hypothetical protein